jgi:alpha-mannosidase
VRLYPGIRRIDISTQVLNNDKFVRYRVLFPTSIQNGKAFHEIPFGAIERKAGIEYPVPSQPGGVGAQARSGWQSHLEAV